MEQKNDLGQEQDYESEEVTASPLPTNLVSIIIPAKDEADYITSVIKNIQNNYADYPFEIIVVDDGSIDNTRTLAKKLDTTVVAHEKNLGKGIAMRTGVNNSLGDVIVFLDGDGAHYPQDITRLITPILTRKTDFVIGSRALPESNVLIGPFSRKLSNKLASFLISVIISFLLPIISTTSYSNRPFKQKWIKITDCTSGFRAINKEGWQRLELISQGFSIETEMIYEAVKNRLTIIEVPIRCNWNKEYSRLSIIRDGLKTLKLLTWKLINDTKRRQRPFYK